MREGSAKLSFLFLLPATPTQPAEKSEADDYQQYYYDRRTSLAIEVAVINSGCVARVVVCAVCVLASALRRLAVIQYFLGSLYQLVFVGVVLIANGHPSGSAAGYAYARTSAYAAEVIIERHVHVAAAHAAVAAAVARRAGLIDGHLLHGLLDELLVGEILLGGEVVCFHQVVGAVGVVLSVAVFSHLLGRRGGFLAAAVARGTYYFAMPEGVAESAAHSAGPGLCRDGCAQYEQ